MAATSPATPRAHHHLDQNASTCRPRNGAEQRAPPRAVLRCELRRGRHLHALLAGLARGAGLGPEQIGVLLAAAFLAARADQRVVPDAADRRGDHRRLMIRLAALTLVATALFALAGTFWLLLLLSMAVGAGRAALLPVGEAMALHASQTQGLATTGCGCGARSPSCWPRSAAACGSSAPAPGIVLGLMIADRAADPPRLPAAAGISAAPAGRRSTAPARPAAEAAGHIPRFRPRRRAHPGQPRGLLRLRDALLALGRLQRGRDGLAMGRGRARRGTLFATAGALMRRVRAAGTLALAGGLAALRWCAVRARHRPGSG